MPCRALEAFGRIWVGPQGGGGDVGLNALSGIGGVGQNQRIRESENQRGGGRLGSRQDTRCPADRPLVIGHLVIGHLVIGHLVIGHFDCPVGHWRRSDRTAGRGPGLRQRFRLNALSGIGGVRTNNAYPAVPSSYCVLMPCRALEAFGLGVERGNYRLGGVLMPCRALEAFGRRRPASGTSAFFKS